jgi:hypothetical protein
MARLSKNSAVDRDDDYDDDYGVQQEAASNVLLLVRAELTEFCPLLQMHGVTVDYHYLLCPNQPLPQSVAVEATLARARLLSLFVTTRSHDRTALQLEIVPRRVCLGCAPCGQHQQLKNNDV